MTAMTPVFAVGGLVLAAAITPGPNNLLVLKHAGERGLRSPLAAIAGIVRTDLQCVSVRPLDWQSSLPCTRGSETVLSFAAGVQLMALRLRLVYRSVASSTSTSPESIAPDGALSLFALQFVNPKAWVLVLTAAATVRCAGT